MFLLGDIGNTDVKFFLVNKSFKIIKKITLKTNLLSNNYLSLKLNFLIKRKNKINKVLFSSVVPNAFSMINFFLKKKLKIKSVLEVKDIDLKKLIHIKVNRKQVGSDRIANAIAMIDKKKNYIIIDFGTATTFDVIKNNQYSGGLIFPGINLSMDTLLKNAELIKTSKISKSNKIVNNNTSASIQSGFYFGYLHAVNGILKQIIKENNFKPKVYITGGLGKIFRDKIIYKPIYMEHLTLEGIKEIGNKHFYE